MSGNLDDMQTRLQNEQEVIATLRDEFSTFNEELSATTAAIKEAEIIQKGSDTMYELEVKDAELLFDRNGNFLKAEKD